MPIWLPAASTAEPSVTLTSWAAFEVLLPQIGSPTAHVVGFSEEGREGRVSSKVLRLDYSRRQATTSTGRVYRLSGPPGLNGDAEYVWTQWLQAWDGTVLRELTLELQQQLDAPPDTQNLKS